MVDCHFFPWVIKNCFLQYFYSTFLCLQRLWQALHALIDLMKWTFPPLAVLMPKASACRHASNYLTLCNKDVAYLRFTEPSERSLEHHSPRNIHPSAVHSYYQMIVLLWRIQKEHSKNICFVICNRQICISLGIIQYNCCFVTTQYQQLQLKKKVFNIFNSCVWKISFIRCIRSDWQFYFL